MNEIKDRYFLFKHEQCGSVFTVNSKTIINKNDNFDDDCYFIQCPSCGEKLLKLNAITSFFDEYKKLDKMLTQKGCSFREIKEPIDPAKLKL